MNKEIREIFIFVFPTIFFISLFILLPVFGSFWISLFRDVSFLPKKFIGFKNYFRLIKDLQFWHSVFFTLTFSFFSVAIEMVLGTIFALILNEKFILKKFIRGIILLPWVIPTVIGARIWQIIYQYNYGLFNYILRKFFGFSINWLGNPISAFFSLVLTDVWRMTPFVVIIILAGLQSIPEDLYKQAKIDGANIFQRFFKITLPSIKGIFIVALLFRTIDAIRVFDIIYILTSGGPAGFTTSTSLYGYKYFLISDFGYGCTISFSLFIIAFTIALIYVKVGKFKELL